ncbi:glycosyl hydrolase family 76-domain-containing protein [Chaetomium sp. MPI-CAGE-AT-0009]|nr:glycosyl hydrolase family 76-domain-containing protein [Chaetomium sp. MPI-CAGE-AT-0009]
MYKTALPLLLAGAGSVSAALQVDLNSTASIKSAAKDVAFDVMSYYKGNQSGETPGIFGFKSASPGNGSHQYMYWQTGAVLWSTMLDYWRYTGDETYNTVTTEGLVHQIDSRQKTPFMSPNWTAGMSTAGHGFWGLSAMLAAELEFPNPPGGELSWIDLAQGVFRALEARFAMETACGGGLRAQIPLINEGYHMKATLPNAVFLNLGARLSRYTGNQSYAEWADKTWEWLFTRLGLHPGQQLQPRQHGELIITTGALLEGAAYMYNKTTGDAQATWRERVRKLATRTLNFDFPMSKKWERILVEYECETRPGGRPACTPQTHYNKGAYLRALASTARLAPFLGGDIVRHIRDSAAAAVAVCDGGETGRACGFVWNRNVWRRRAVSGDDSDDDEEEEDRGIYGPGGGPAEEMNALSVLLGLLVDEPASRGFATGPGVKPPGNGDRGSAGTTTRVAVGWMVAGLVAALF